MPKRRGPSHQRLVVVTTDATHAAAAVSSFPAFKKDRTRRPVTPGMMKFVVLLAVVGGIFVSLQQQQQQRERPGATTNTWLRQSTTTSSSSCSIWMAPSSLQAKVGLGIYTTRDLQTSESILAAPDGPSLPVLYTSARHVDAALRPAHDAWHKLFDEFWWGRGVPDHVFYEGKSVIDYQITLGSLPNHHCLLGAIDVRYPEVAYHDALLDRFVSPGAGAVSYHRGRDFFVDRPVVAGEELFLNYGYCQVDPHRDPQGSHGWAANIAMPVDVQEAATLIRRQWQQKQTSTKSNQPLQWPHGSNEFVQSLLPDTQEDLQALMEHVQPDMSSKDVARVVARFRGTHVRTVEWIQSHGMCLEHLVPGPSVMPHAGQGAMAQHFIGQGEMVVPAPLLHILDRNVLRLDGHTTQLLYNYCLGHPQTPLLLCPNTNAILINHCSTRHESFQRHCPQGPNAAFRWASGWDPDSPQWQAMAVEEIAQQKGRGLAMEVVALRPIQPNEEVFVDYGMAWEDAWFRHLETWKPPQRTADPWITAEQANAQTDSILPAWVSGDLRKTTDHPYLFTGCWYWTTGWEDHKVFAKPNPDWPKLSDKDLLDTYADDGGDYEGEYTHHSDQTHWPCSVLKENKDGTYTVRIHQSDWYEKTPWHINKLPRLLKNYPRSSIHYFVKPFHGDNHLPGAFRHYVGIPEDIMPEQWKTLSKSE